MVSGMQLGFLFFFFQAEDGIRDLVRSRGLGDVYKRQLLLPARHASLLAELREGRASGCPRNGIRRRPDEVLSLIHI